jgi:hypothetical protein
MAKISKSMSFKDAEINLEDLSLTEFKKDNTTEYNIMDILKEWNGIKGISLVIKLDNDVNTIGEDDESSDGEDDEL